jgi:phenylacetate-CoA ligase
MKPIIKNILFPVHELLKGHKTISYLKELEHSQWYSREQLHKLQSGKLRELIAYAYKHVPYYRELFDSVKMYPDDIKTSSDLKKLPFLTKDIIRKQTEMLKSDTSKNLKRFNTGGSTGAPLQFYLGKRRIGYDIAAKLRAAGWWGVGIGDPEIVIWGSPVELTKQDMVRKMRDRLFKSCLLSAFDMGENRMDEYLAAIRKFRPKHVFGYPSSIYMLSKYAEQKNISLGDLGVKVVFCTAEKLYEYQRLLISEVFNAPVANGYGGRDTGFIAHECPETSGMHITAESIIIEIIDHEGNSLPAGHKGEIIITNLDTHDFPFIRYRTGDIGVLSGDICACGRGLPLLKDIEGRTTDFIITPDKKIMHGLSLIYILREINGIEEFKIVQEEIDLFSVSIVKNFSFNPESEEVIRKGFRDRIGSEVKIKFNYQQKIEPEKSGKFRYVVSKVQQLYIT